MPEPAKPRNGEVWNVFFDPVRGYEQGGVGPAVVISNNRFNRAFETLIIVVPMTRTDRGIPTQVRIDPPEGGTKAPSLVMCEQVRAGSIERFRRKRGEVSPETLARVEEIVANVTSREHLAPACKR